MIIEEVRVKEKNIDNYVKVVGEGIVHGLKKLTHPLEGKKVIHVNSTAKGGGVAEILHSLVPLQRSLGVNSRWFVVNPPARFFDITKRFHNALQGAEIKFSKAELDYYIEINRQFAEDLGQLEADLFIIHDPQPLASSPRLRRPRQFLEFTLISQLRTNSF